MRTASWILTDARPIYSGGFTFRCSACNRYVTVMEQYKDGQYDIEPMVHYLMNEYPYCHCGAKMSKDPQIKAKMQQLQNSYAKHSFEKKDTWEVGEVADPALV